MRNIHHVFLNPGPLKNQFHSLQFSDFPCLGEYRREGGTKLEKGV